MSEQKETVLKPRESFASRLGFIFMAAGCAIGLGNVWRFPYITGKYGGALFVLIYLVFLVILGFPVMVAELSIGRAGRHELPGAMKILRTGKSSFPWEIPATIAFVGNLVLLMFYSVVTGWMLAYTWKYCSGALKGFTDFGASFGGFLGSWQQQIIFTAIAILVTVAACVRGLQKGVEKTIKVMMGGLFLLQLILIIQVLCFKNSWEGVKFFLAPDVSKIQAAGIGEVIYAALAQAFFTLSLGVGSIAICGSYTGKDRSLPHEASVIIILDTIAAIASGLIIFPVCASFGINPNAGPALIFVTLPKAFSAMPGGFWLGLLFFIFMSVAALSTLIAVAENLIAYGMDQYKMSRLKATCWFGVLLFILSIPCALGFNLWSKFEPLGKGTCVLDLEDFIVSNNLLPLGSAMIVLFCTTKFGWGSENFLAEVNTGKGFQLKKWIIPYMKYVLPLIILGLWAYDMYHKFF